MRYARFHADYTDVGRYFDRVALALGRQNAPPGCNPGCSLLIRITRAARAARQRAAGQQIEKQARQESNLQPPVLEASLPSPPKTRPLPNCPCKTEIARAPFRARLR